MKIGAKHLFLARFTPQMYNESMTNKAKDDKGYIDWNHDWNYPLQWLYESDMARQGYQCLLYRVALAMEGKPWKNLYQEELESNLKKLTDKSPNLQDKYKCIKVPEGRSLSLARAVKNRANQMSTGVDTYEYQVNDPYMIIDDETEDMLGAKCEQDYYENKLGVFASVFSRDLTTAGVTAVKVGYDPIHDKNKICRINPKNIIWDTKYSSTGRERFRGYNTMISWAKLKKMIEDDPNEEINLDIKAPDRSIIGEKGVDKFVDKTAKYNNRKIRSLNGLDIYVDTMNKLAGSYDLAGDLHDQQEFTHDLKSCYNLNWYRSFADLDDARTKSGYNGDDVELTVLYDMENHIEFKIINRRYVISANGVAFHRFINFPVTNPVDGSLSYHMEQFTLECPIKFQFEWQNNRDIAPYPTSPVINVLDLHDKLCAWRAKREHVAKILSILRVTTNAGDAETLRDQLNIMGIVLDDVQGDIGTVNFVYDWTAIDSEIAYLENEIKTYLSGYDEFDAMQMMGDRASAAESGMAIGAVAQGLATHQNAIMELYSDIARQCIANRVVYSSVSEFPVINHGNYSSLTIQQMALSAVINVKPKLAKKVQEKMIATNSLTLLGTFGQTLSPEGQAFLTEQALMGTAPRKMIASFIQQQQADPAAVQAAQLEGQNMANILSQNEQAYMNDPMSYEADNVMQNNSPEDIDAIIGQMSAQGGQSPAVEPATGNLSEAGDFTSMVDQLNMPQQEGAISTDLPGLTSDSGSAMANPNSMI